MLKFVLVALFALSLGTITVAASLVPAGSDAVPFNTVVVADVL